MKRMPCTFAGALREGRSPWQLGRASRSCFENICVFDLKMIQSKDDTVYVKYKMPQNSRGPFSRGKALCVLPPVPCQSKEKALHRLSFRRQSWFWWLFALCPLCVCVPITALRCAQHRHSRDLGRSWCRLQLTGRGLSDQRLRTS